MRHSYQCTAEGNHTIKQWIHRKFGGHPVINIAHLEPYHQPLEVGDNRPKLPSRRKTFEDLEEFEVDFIVDSKIVKGPKGRSLRKYRVRWKGYSPRYDTWESTRNLRNAPETLRDFERDRVRYLN